MPITMDEFIKWLQDENYRPLLFTQGDTHHALLKVPKNEQFDYLYSQYNYRKYNIERNANFEYAGVYCRQDGLIYDSYGKFRSIAEGVECHIGRDQMQKDLESAVRAKVETIIADNRRNLRVSMLTSDAKITDYNYFVRHVAPEKARELFLRNTDITDISFRCNYEFDGWNEDNYLQYILDRDGFSQQQSNKYIDENQEDMFSQFLENDVLKLKLQSIIDNPDSTLHRIKEIMKAVGESGAKTVNVTILKDNQEFTFKTEADTLTRDPGNHYSNWYIAAADRREFEKVFGRSADYTPDEITQITYGRNTLYEAEPPEPAQNEDESMGMSM
ncbi:MAG TPA: hypothetical protein DEP23_00150 [Ruminococcaceae bacterium]|nr:hypothetical protein [Oscillospiraceae bacterium]